MKKLLFFLAMLGTALNVLAQGEVILANNSTSLIYFEGTGAPIAVGSVVFQLYAAVGTGQSEEALTAVGPLVSSSLTFAGRIQNTTIYVPQAPNGQSVTFQIWAWTGAFATREEAFEGGAQGGKSILFNSPTSFQGPGDPIPIPVSLAGKYPGFAVGFFPALPVPEPSTMALGILGAASLWFLKGKR